MRAPVLVLALTAVAWAQEGALEGGAPPAAAGAAGARPDEAPEIPRAPPEAPAAKPPSVRELTFEEAVDQGLAYNLGLKSRRFDALIARMDVEEEEDAAWGTTLDGPDDAVRKGAP